MAEHGPEVTKRFHGTPEQMAGAVVGEPPTRWSSILIEDYDPLWAVRFGVEAARIRDALGGAVVELEHVGSTSVPGLAAKPIIDIDLTLTNTVDEAAYVPALESTGYVLLLREPEWHQHRMLVDSDEDVHLHVWPGGAPELTRHRLFRDWLRTHPEDRDLYATTKRRIVRETIDRPGDYTLAKSDVIDAIFERIFLV
jgi:GrpB-like predicted nucleotidyltransferase (UPF0157 family)